MTGSSTTLHQLIGIAIICLAVHTHAFVGATDLSSLCAESDLIAIVNIPTVHSTNRVNIAEATIEQKIKGEQILTNVYFLASPSWTYDISNAEPEETALVFLSIIKNRAEVHGKDWKLPLQGYEPLYRISHVGRGRMPVREKNNVKYAEVWNKDIKFTPLLKTFPSQWAPQYDFIVDLQLDEFVRLIEQEVAHPTIGSYTSVFNREVFYVSGSVKEPGQLDLYAGMTLRDAIQLAGGFESGAERLTLTRGGQVIYDITPCADFDFSVAPLLKAGDVIKVE